MGSEATRRGGVVKVSISAYVEVPEVDGVPSLSSAERVAQMVLQKKLDAGCEIVMELEAVWGLDEESVPMAVKGASKEELELAADGASQEEGGKR